MFWTRPLAVGRAGLLIAIALACTAVLWVFEGRLVGLPILLAVGWAVASRGGVRLPAPRELPEGAGSWTGPLLAAAATLLTAFWVWGGLRPLPIVHDEAAYLLQSQLFASARWSDPPPPLPEFFEQVHVLVEPRRAAKYLPGHSLALLPGVAAGLSAAMPLLMAAATGALLYAIARRLAGASAAALTWLVWAASPLGLRYRSSFFSEVTTALMWLAAWAAVDRWRRSGKSVWLVAAAVAVGWGAITRPLTMLLLAVPLAVLVLGEAARRRAWAPPMFAAATGVLVLLLLPLWSARTTGDWRTSPLGLYTRQYLPFDKLGFGLTEDQPTRDLPPDMQSLSRYFSVVHRSHVPARLPATFAARADQSLRDAFGAGRILLLPLALIGCFALRGEGRLMVAGGALLILGHLCYAQRVHWTVYSFEALAPLALAAGTGLATTLAGMPRRMRLAGHALAVACLLFFLVRTGLAERRFKQYQREPFERLAESVTGLGDQRSIVFVRYARAHDMHLSLIRNGPDIASARTWIVYDRGAENARLMAIDPSRAAYLYDEETGKLVPWPQDPSVVSLSR